MDWSCPRCEFDGDSYKSFASHFTQKHEGSAFLAVIGEEELRERYSNSSEMEIAEKFGVHRKAVQNALREANIERRGRSEAAKLRANREGSIHEDIAPLGAEARLENGMKGVTGQDHPRWRGGKSVYDAVKRQLPGPSWNTVRDRHLDDRCANCGESSDLELHHIVPILSGGTNESWNLLTLCQSCHYQAEWVVRDLLDPVLLE